MKRHCWAGIEIAWDAGDLPFDPFAPALPLPLAADAEMPPGARLTIRASLAAQRAQDPTQDGASPVLFHGRTRCFATESGLVVWDGASRLLIARDGQRIEALVHASSLEQGFHFTSVTVTMALLLALRHHGLFHLHAAAMRWPDGRTWLLPGESGCGKSTLALAAFAAGAQWLSDDAVLLRSAGSDVEVVGWARMIRMTAQTAEAFPELRPMLARCPEGAARDFEVDPRRAFPARGLALAASPFVLLYPQIAEHPSSHLAALNRAEAFGQILHACAWVASEHVPGRSDQLALLSRLIDAAPAFELRAGRHLLREPAAAVAEIRQQLDS